MREQDKAIARDLSETYISSMADGKLKATIKRISTELEKRTEIIRKTLTIKVKELKKTKPEMKNQINGIGNRLDTVNSRLVEAEEWISNLEDKIMENNEAEQKREILRNTIDVGNSVTPSNVITFLL